MKHLRGFVASLPLLVPVAAGVAGCATLGFGVTSEIERQAAEKRRRTAEEERRAAEEARRTAEAKQREEEVLKDLPVLRAAFAQGDNKVRSAREFATLVGKAPDAPAAKDGRLDVNALSLEAAGYLEQALAIEASRELFELLRGLPPGPRELDAAVVRGCARVRPKIGAPELE